MTSLVYASYWGQAKALTISATIQVSTDYATLYDHDNKVIKSMKLPKPNAFAIPVAKLRVFAKNNGIEVK